VLQELALENLGKRVSGSFDMYNLEQTLRIIVTATSLHDEKGHQRNYHAIRGTSCQKPIVKKAPL